MSKILTNSQVQDIFIKICEENQWKVSVWQNKSNKKDIDYTLIEKNEDVKDRDDISEMSIEEFARKIDFYEDNNKEVSVGAVPATPRPPNTDFVNLRISHANSFFILSQILLHSDYKTLNKIKFFGNTRVNGSDINWRNLIDMINFQKNATTPEAFKIMLTHYVDKLNDRNLKEIFSEMNNLNLPKKDLYPTINNFCANHLDQLLQNITYKNFIINQVKNFIPEHTNYFKNFLQVSQLEGNLFSEEQNHYKVFHLSKQVLFNNYPLAFDKPVEVEDYHIILDNAVNFLNKPANLKKIGASHLEFMGKQKKHEAFILTVQTTDKFDMRVVEDFILKTLEECLNQKVDASNKNISHAHALREVIKKSYNSILNFALLDGKIPHKEGSSPVRRKI